MIPVDSLFAAAQIGVDSATGNVVLPYVSFQAIIAWILNTFFDIAGGNYAATLDALTFGFKFFSTFLCLAFIAGTIYARVMVTEVEGRMKQQFAPKPEIGEGNATVSAVGSSKWQKIVEHAGSANANDWRLAILEADILLDDMLKQNGALGDTIGERLKSMTVNQMPSLQKAWEAHLVRNQIAHEGTDFNLSQHEARRIISLYEQVLREGAMI